MQVREVSGETGLNWYSLARLFGITLNEEGFKEGTLLHNVSVCPCLSETVCAHTFCMWLHCFDMLLSPGLRMKTAYSSSWGSSPTSFLTRITCLVLPALYMQ